jgi:hypothetical protein
MNEYCRWKIEYLWNAVDFKKTEHSDSLNLQSSYLNSNFRIAHSEFTHHCPFRHH